ncbi:MAG: IS200/IS605 family transposase [Planctomycetaceae bacterium]|nr:IS200/IS605 family transposase [Planctomycetaceae bacterium]
MSNTNLIYHVVFSTKERKPFLKENEISEVSKYIAGIVRNLKGIPLAIHGMADHFHVALIAPPTAAVASLVGKLKSNSSRWIHQTLPGLKSFAWQDGYAAFSVSQSVKNSVVRYVLGQTQHHKKKSFQEELITLLELNEIEYDKRYIWA